MTHAVEVRELTHRYGQRVALDHVNFELASGGLHVFLGPNGGGKTTLFRILSTLMPSQSGTVKIFGDCTVKNFTAVRHKIGVVFQHPSLDKKLTVEENFRQQAALYGIAGEDYERKRTEVSRYLGVHDRLNDIVETLSGGLRRRVDLAKSILHQPRLLLLDEPTTGLDPGARSDLWRYLKSLQAERETTIIATSHLLEEADRADRVLILNLGQIVASGAPEELRSTLGGDTVTVESTNPADLQEELNRRWNCEAVIVDQEVRFAVSAGTPTIDEVAKTFPGQIKSVKLGQPTLEDVFIERTGHRFWSPPSDEESR